MKAPLILLPSKKMDNNNKKDRREDGLIRMSEKARQNLGLENDKSVEVWPNSDNDLDRDNRSKLLTIYIAYSSDLNDLKASEMPEADQLRVGFVTARVFDAIISKKEARDVWVADSVSDILIGADPEFILIDPKRNKMVPACEIRELSKTLEFGSDGYPAEIRPNPTVSVKKFLDAILKLFTSDTAKAIKQYDWLAIPHYEELSTSRYVDIGGHLHFGVPRRVANLPDNLRVLIFAILTRVLDELISIPMMHLEGVQISCIRRNKYGYFGDYRTDHARLEYRVLSAEWLSHPKIAEAVLGTSKAVVQGIYQMIEKAGFDSKYFTPPGGGGLLFSKEYLGWKDVTLMQELGVITNNNIIYEALHHTGIQVNKSYIKELKQKFERLPTCGEFGKYIDLFMALLKAPAASHAKRDRRINVNWLQADGKHKIYKSTKEA